MHFLNSKFILHKQLLKISLTISRIDKILFGGIISLNYQKKKMLRINNMISIQSIGFQRVSQDWSDLACRPPTKVIRGDKATSLLPSCVQAFLFLNSLLESGWEFLSKKKKNEVWCFSPSGHLHQPLGNVSGQEVVLCWL